MKIETSKLIPVGYEKITIDFSTTNTFTNNINNCSQFDVQIQ